MTLGQYTLQLSKSSEVSDIFGTFLLIVGLFLFFFIGALALLTMITNRMDKTIVETGEPTEPGDFGEVGRKEKEVKKKWI